MILPPTMTTSTCAVTPGRDSHQLAQRVDKYIRTNNNDDQNKMYALPAPLRDAIICMRAVVNLMLIKQFPGLIKSQNSLAGASKLVNKKFKMTIASFLPGIRTHGIDFSRKQTFNLATHHARAHGVRNITSLR